MKQKWAKLTDNDLTYVEGKRDQLLGGIQERYGTAKDQAEKASERVATVLLGTGPRYGPLPVIQPLPDART